MPKIIITGHLTKPTKYLSKLKETLINVCEKSHFKKQKQNFLWIPGFQISSMVKNKNPEILKINRKLNQKVPTANGLSLLESC